MKCRYCGSKRTIKNGFHITTKGKYQRHKCNGCGRVTIGGKKRS